MNDTSKNRWKNIDIEFLWSAVTKNVDSVCLQVVKLNVRHKIVVGLNIADVLRVLWSKILLKENDEKQKDY